MKKTDYKILFADLDGTLITTASGKTFPEGIWDMKLRFDTLEAIKKLAPKRVFIVSNQGGIEKGYSTDYLFTTKIHYGCIVGQQHILKEYHPAYYARTGEKMSHGLFVQINQLLDGMYGEKISFYKETDYGVC